MKKHLYSTLAGALAMFIVFILFGFVEMHFFGTDVYSEPPFIDYAEKMGLFTLMLIGIKLFHAFLLSYLHEVIPRCHGSLWPKVWRFSILASLLVFGPGLLITAATMTVNPWMIFSWVVSGVLQTFAASAVMIPILYKFPEPNRACKLQDK